MRGKLIQFASKIIALNDASVPFNYGEKSDYSCKMTEARLAKHDKTSNYIERNNRSALLLKEHSTLLENNINFTARKVVDGALTKF